MPYTPITLGTRLRRAREAARLSQEAVARQAGISQRTVSRIENGELADPGFVSLARVSAVLALPLNTLAQWAGLVSPEELQRMIDESDHAGS